MVAAFDNHTYLLKRLGHCTVQNECRLKLYRPCEEKTGQTPGTLDRTGCKKPARDRQNQRHTPASPSGPVVRYEPQLEEKPDTYFRPLQDKGIKEELETTPVEIENHIPPVEYQAAGQTDVMEPDQAEELAENIEDIH